MRFLCPIPYATEQGIFEQLTGNEQGILDAEQGISVPCDPDRINILVLRQQINVLRRRTPKRPRLNNTDHFSVRLALSPVSLRPWRGCDCQAGDHHSLAPRRVSGVLALAVAQPCWQTEGLD